MRRVGVKLFKVSVRIMRWESGVVKPSEDWSRYMTRGHSYAREERREGLYSLAAVQ